MPTVSVLIAGDRSILNTSGVLHGTMAQSPTNPEPLSITEQPRLRVKVPLGWLWPLFWGALMVGSGILGVWAILWLTRIPPLPNCEDVSPASSPSNRLICAQAKLQASGVRDLAEAVALTARWSESHSLHREASPVLFEASQRLLEKATREMHQGNLSTAVTWAGYILPDTPLRPEAQAAIWAWQQEWKKGEAIATAVRSAIENQDWAAVAETLPKLKLLTSDYWLRQQHSELLQAMQQEKAAWAQIAQARTLAASEEPEALGEALTLAQQVDLTSRAWTTAQADIDQWSQTLLRYGVNRWRQGDEAGAIAVVQQVPPDPSLVPEAQELLRFSHAHRLADEVRQQQRPSFMQLLSLMEAIRAVERIEPSSPFYSAAQPLLKEWQLQLADLRTLQLANVVAGLQQPWSYQYASQLAWIIDANRPGRLQAQTLIAHWEDEVERVEDRPYLRQASALAQKGTISALEMAIAEARKVLLGRALRIDAQTLIADWSNRIEIIQDQPILNQANTLAQAGTLQEAITVAQGITADRALYDQAQAMIIDWTQTIEIQEDTPIFREAKDLAFAGSLTRAIDLASQIAPGRALYDEVQAAIALWEAERAYIWSIRAADTEAGTNADTEADADTTERETAPRPRTPNPVPPNQLRPPVNRR